MRRSSVCVADCLENPARFCLSKWHRLQSVLFMPSLPQEAPGLICACLLMIAKIIWLAQAEACATKGFADILAELVR